MQIQYAVFCETIDCKELPPTFKKPISTIVVSDISQLTKIELPLFISFINGSEGKHFVRLSIITPSRTIPIPDFSFIWPKGAITQSSIFTINFQPDTFGLYTFRLNVDGGDLRDIPIPIIKQ